MRWGGRVWYDTRLSLADFDRQAKHDHSPVRPCAKNNEIFMTEFAKEVLPVNLEDEMRQSYLDYAMSVIVGRALPDVRDGLKPVHRRVLYRHERTWQRLEQALQEIRARRRRRHR